MTTDIKEAELWVCFHTLISAYSGMRELILITT